MKPENQKTEEKPVVLVAIYTRKSGDENLDGTVTSIDSQKAACRSYIEIHGGHGTSASPAHGGQILGPAGKGNRERLVPIGKQACTAIESYLAERARRFANQPGPAFLSCRGQKLSRGSFGQRLKIYARRAGIRRQVYPHLLRHCFASHIIGRGADLKSLQEMLGHQSLSTTAIDLHVNPQRLVEVYRSSHPRA